MEKIGRYGALFYNQHFAPEFYQKFHLMNSIKQNVSYFLLL